MAAGRAGPQRRALDREDVDTFGRADFAQQSADQNAAIGALNEGSAGQARCHRLLTSEGDELSDRGSVHVVWVCDRTGQCRSVCVVPRPYRQRLRHTQQPYS